MAPVAGFHLHFYQPPRENPWLGLSTHEWSAWPFHDWNERISAECYRAMVAVALAGDEGAVELYEPLARSSVDVGPTLHHWLDREAPDVGDALRRQVTRAPGGAGALVLAAPLVHAIMPLASPVDQERLVAWGIQDFRHRYGEAPRGMWLPETAVDLTTLGIVADQGITYTVLMAGQAVRVRPPGGEWVPVRADTLDTSRPYFVRLTDGRRLTIVFGHHDLSQRVAFGGLIDDGVHLADVMADAVGSEDGVVLVVADGETYGHHHHFGDLGLSWAVRRLERHHGVATALGSWLADQSPNWEVELAEPSAWSCAHGVERWRSDCGCVTGERPGWSLDWRAPLREALDWLRETVGSLVERELAGRVASVDATLRDYGRVIAGELDPATFALAQASGPPDDDDVTAVLELCEAYRNLLYSFTSCAWFFADPGEIETSIALRYAAVALEGVRRLLGEDFEAAFVERLGEVRSAHYGVAGAQLWSRACDGSRFDDERVAAAAAAEFVAGGDAAPRRRGRYDLEFEARGDALRVSTVYATTRRRRTFDVRVRREGPFGWFVTVDSDGRSVELATKDFGDDVVARLAAAQLLGTAHGEVDRALNELAADLLSRPATFEDEIVLASLACAPRYVTPIGESAIRRALWAMARTRPADGHWPELVGLAAAVGLAPPGPPASDASISH